MRHTLTPAQPAVIQSRDPRPLTIAVRTMGGASGLRTCGGNVTVSVDLLNARIQGSQMAFSENHVLTQSPQPNVLCLLIMSLVHNEKPLVKLKILRCFSIFCPRSLSRGLLQVRGVCKYKKVYITYLGNPRNRCSNRPWSKLL